MTCRFKAARTDEIQQGRGAAVVRKANAKCMKTVDSLLADKTRLIAEATRIVRPGGVIAFTDWVEGPAGLTDSEAQRFLGMMTFANVEDIAGYVNLLSGSGCEVRVAEDTGRFPSYIDLSRITPLNRVRTGDKTRLAQEVAAPFPSAHSGRGLGVVRSPALVQTSAANDDALPVFSKCR
jgi:hypothetical protein